MNFANDLHAFATGLRAGLAVPLQRAFDPAAAQHHVAVVEHHGLAGRGIVVPADLAGAIDRRKRDWRPGFLPDGPEQEWLFDRLCTDSVPMGRCVDRGLTLEAEAARRAAETWDDQKALEAEQLAAGLARRPGLAYPSRSGARGASRC